MPIYEYRCAACGHDLEALQRMSEAHLRKCPECGMSQFKRLVSASRFRLKGSGWYETDFKDKNEKKRNLVEKGGTESSDSASDKTTDTSAKEAAGKAVADAKNDSAAPTPAKPKSPSSKPATAKRSKSAAKPRSKAARR
jgi:putative FmdB family regulatory protein